MVISNECIEYFRKFNFNNNNNNNNYAIYKFNEADETLHIDDDGDRHPHPQHNNNEDGGEENDQKQKKGREISLEELVETKLAIDNNCKYCFYKFKYMSETDKIERCKVVFIHWSPPSASRKQKMLSAFFAQSFLHQVGASSAISCQLQASSPSSLQYNDVLEKLFRSLSVK